MLEKCLKCNTSFEVDESLITSKLKLFKCSVCGNEWPFVNSKNPKICNDWLPSISNIGTRPTVSGDSVNLETHIIDFKENNFDKNLYGKRIKVELIEFLRPEKKFNSLSELQKQIEVDTKRAYEFHEL